MEVELFATGVLKKEETTNQPEISTFAPPNLKIRLGTVPALTTYRQQSSSEPGQRTDVQSRLGKHQREEPSILGEDFPRTCQSNRGDDQHL